MSSTSTATGVSRALILSGGGPVGISWQCGIAVGLAESGVSLREADLVAGTSAGSVVGAQLSLDEDLRDRLGYLDSLGIPDGSGSRADELQTLFAVMAEAVAMEQAEAGRRMIGRLAVGAHTIAEQTFVDSFSFLDGRGWPEGYACTAVDADTGEFQVWDSASSVPLSRAVASSCSAPMFFPVVTLNGSRYMDGGLRSNLNADLATGYDRVVAISCLPITLPPGPQDPTLKAMAESSHAEVAALREGGSLVEPIEPAEEFLEISGGGVHLMDFGRTREAFAAGMRQAELELDRIRTVWSP